LTAARRPERRAVKVDEAAALQAIVPHSRAERKCRRRIASSRWTRTGLGYSVVGMKANMSRNRRSAPRAVLLAAASSLLLAACSAGPGPFRSDAQPSTTEDICQIFRERPHWLDAARKAQAKWKVPAALQMAIIWRESAFRGNVRPPRTFLLGFIPAGRPSSSTGFTQAVDGTWKWYVDSTGNRGAQRSDFADSADFVGWYVDRSRRSNGIAKTDAYRNYLAYHEGHGGYRKGSYRSKPGVLKAAREVERMYKRYQGQLRRCWLG